MRVAASALCLGPAPHLLLGCYHVRLQGTSRTPPANSSTQLHKPVSRKKAIHTSNHTLGLTLPSLCTAHLTYRSWHGGRAAGTGWGTDVGARGSEEHVVLNKVQSCPPH